MLIGLLVRVATHWCCHLVSCVAVDATVFSRQPAGPAHGGSPRPNKAIVEGSGHVSGWPAGGTKAPCSSAVLMTPGHLYVPFAKRRKRLSSPFQGGKHCHPYNGGGDSACARTRQSVSVWCCFVTESVGWVSTHASHMHRDVVHLHINLKESLSWGIDSVTKSGYGLTKRNVKIVKREHILIMTFQHRLFCDSVTMYCKLYTEYWF